MATIGYTRSFVIKREEGFGQKALGVAKTKFSRNTFQPTAHIPQGRNESLCGNILYETLEVEDDSDIKICKTCQARLAGLFRHHPGSSLLKELFGNNLLPSG